MNAYQLAARFVAKHAQHVATLLLLAAALAATTGNSLPGQGIGDLACDRPDCEGGRVIESFGEIPCDEPGCDGG